MNDQNFKKIFTTHKVDIPDEDFSEQIIKQLPERKSILPQVVMITFIAIGLVLTFAIQGFVPVLEQVNHFVVSISLRQIPPASSIITCFSAMALIGFIAHSVDGDGCFY